MSSPVPQLDHASPLPASSCDTGLATGWLADQPCWADGGLNLEQSDTGQVGSVTGEADSGWLGSLLRSRLGGKKSGSMPWHEV